MYLEALGAVRDLLLQNSLSLGLVSSRMSAKATTGVPADGPSQLRAAPAVPDPGEDPGSLDSCESQRVLMQELSETLSAEPVILQAANQARAHGCSKCSGASALFKQADDHLSRSSSSGVPLGWTVFSSTCIRLKGVMLGGQDRNTQPKLQNPKAAKLC